MNNHDKIDLVMQWRVTPEGSSASEENLGILRDVIDYASASPDQYGVVSCPNFQMCVAQILAEIESYNAPLTRLLGAYSRQQIQEDKDAILRDLEFAEENAKSDYERDIIRGYRQRLL